MSSTPDSKLQKTIDKLAGREVVLCTKIETPKINSYAAYKGNLSQIKYENDPECENSLMPYVTLSSSRLVSEFGLRNRNVMELSMKALKSSGKYLGEINIELPQIDYGFILERAPMRV